MKCQALFLLAAAVFSLTGFAQTAHAESASPQSWAAVKNSQIPKNEMPGLYGAPQPQANATLVWEDGVYMTRDGLTLYADYYPADALTAIINGDIPLKTYLYRRGPDIGQDFSNPIGQDFPWIHGDVAYATRDSVSQPFSAWKLTGLKGKFYNHGAPQGILNPRDPSKFDYFVYTYDNPANTKIMMLRDTDRSLRGEGKKLPDNVSDPRYHEDNPHIERYDVRDPRKLVLFFDSNDWPNGKGSHDIWYTLSDDGGDSWRDPQPISLNTEIQEHQPHLYFDGAIWWLYYSATNPADQKLGIYRARQAEPNNWGNWVNKELVVSAGDTAGVGEPTLTARGDLSFEAVIHNPQGTDTDRLDCDPWFMPRK